MTETKKRILFILFLKLNLTKVILFGEFKEKHYTMTALAKRCSEKLFKTLGERESISFIFMLPLKYSFFITQKIKIDKNKFKAHRNCSSIRKKDSNFYRN